MKTAKTITITEDDILIHFIGIVEGCTTEEAKKIIDTALVNYKIGETGDYDKGTYEQFLENITITYEWN